VGDIRIFVGGEEEAYKAACLDSDQFLIDYIKTYRGDPGVRTTMEFLALFMDASEVWLRWTEDLCTTAQYVKL
jgi:hypothetical protein